ncbi:CLUMA_CG010087, isoform A [Clunio marinus]|uniref:CLUMA_CG010087, isoform A n=1 Tax=Clunio marinus TaxID=568069 RepID=A0A1J1I8R1_9DIPT|nr:CLUMA_CG010087, isoform A [Clunio marinus]
MFRSRKTVANSYPKITNDPKHAKKTSQQEICHSKSFLFEPSSAFIYHNCPLPFSMNAILVHYTQGHLQKLKHLTIAYNNFFYSNLYSTKVELYQHKKSTKRKSMKQKTFLRTYQFRKHNNSSKFLPLMATEQEKKPLIDGRIFFTTHWVISQEILCGKTKICLGNCKKNHPSFEFEMIIESLLSFGFSFNEKSMKLHIYCHDND